MMVKTLRWYWIRLAPAVNPNVPFYWKGAQIDLSVRRVSEFVALAGALPRDARHWITSPSQQTIDTASALLGTGAFSKDTLPVVACYLNEQNFGAWEDAPPLKVNNSATFQRYMRDPVHVTPPGGESLSAFQTRIIADLGRLSAGFCRVAAAKNMDVLPIVSISHPGIIRAAISQAASEPIVDTLKRPVPPLSLTVIEQRIENGNILSSTLAQAPTLHA